MELPDIPFVNTTLIKAPMNWVVVFTAATLSLLAFHVAMMAFKGMQSNLGATIGANPGQVAAPTQNAAANFGTPGALAGGATVVPGLFAGGAPQIWTDDAEAKYAEDGWYANP